MSDRTPCNYCDGWEGDHVVDCPAPLSPIALDFAQAIREALAEVGYREHPDYLVAINASYQRQLRALVARVAQEEREKALKEVWEEMLAVVRPGHPPDWSAFVDRITHLRGTP